MAESSHISNAVPVACQDEVRSSGFSVLTGGLTSRSRRLFEHLYVLPRIFENVFKMFAEDPSIKDFTVSLQFIELYNEQPRGSTRSGPQGGPSPEALRPSG